MPPISFAGMCNGAPSWQFGAVGRVWLHACHWVALFLTMSLLLFREKLVIDQIFAKIRNVKLAPVVHSTFFPALPVCREVTEDSNRF